MEYGFDTFLSPMTWRYGSPEIRRIWSEEGKRLALRQVWVAVAEVQNTIGLISDEALSDIKEHSGDIDINRSLEIEKQTRHDLMAEIRAFAEQCPVGGGSIHLGCTSMDIEDNVDALRIRQSLQRVTGLLRQLIAAFEKQIRAWADCRCMAFTHIQSAEPTTVGYRLAQTAQDLLTCLERLESLRIKGKGFKGAAGTGASFCTLLEGTGTDFDSFEKQVADRLGLEVFEDATQVYTRLQDLQVMQALSLLCAAIHKFALDFRILQGSSIGEFGEYFAPGQVGSSAMPFKRNPINCEKICSLCRLVRSWQDTAWDNSALNILERTLDDSANRRVFLPESFIAVDEILRVATSLVERMNVNTAVIRANFDRFGVFAATERLLMILSSKGADRQKMHEVIRRCSLQAWDTVTGGGANNLADLLAADPEILGFMSEKEIRAALDAADYVGIAPGRALSTADRISEVLKKAGA
ncbi:MAG: adenylosuccinate lyase [Spirochaetales bacterium]|nr:adenylosuccinate lyase [Spirochaetales bacterium]